MRHYIRWSWILMRRLSAWGMASALMVISICVIPRQMPTMLHSEKVWTSLGWTLYKLNKFGHVLMEGQRSDSVQEIPLGPLVNRQTDRNTRLKTLPSHNFIEISTSLSRTYTIGVYFSFIQMFSKKDKISVKLQRAPLLAFIALSAAQSSAQTCIHSAILVIDTSNNASYNQVHWLARTPFLSIKASNEHFQNPL